MIVSPVVVFKKITSGFRHSATLSDAEILLLLDKEAAAGRLEIREQFLRAELRRQSMEKK